MGKGCDKAIKDLCKMGVTLPFVCRSLHYFARASRSVDESAYCSASFKNPNQAFLCNRLFELLGGDEGRRCGEFPPLVWKTVESLPSSVKVPREIIRKKLGIPYCVLRRIRLSYRWCFPYP